MTRHGDGARVRHMDIPWDVIQMDLPKLISILHQHPAATDTGERVP